MSLISPALAGGFFSTRATWELHDPIILKFFVILLRIMLRLKTNKTDGNK